MLYFLLLWLLLWDIIFPWKCSKSTKFIKNLTNFEIWLKKIGPIEFFHFFDFGMSICSTLKKCKNWRCIFSINIQMHPGLGCWDNLFSFPYKHPLSVHFSGNRTLRAGVSLKGPLQSVTVKGKRCDHLFESGVTKFCSEVWSWIHSLG